MKHRMPRVAGSALPAYLVTLVVVIAAIYAFAPRSHPPAPETKVHPTDLLVNGLAQQGERLLAVGEQGHILIADRSDGPWREAKVTPERGSTLTQVAFIGDKTALAVGHDSLILKSTDSGETWKEVSFDPERSEPLLAVAGPFDGNLFAIGGFGQFMKSTDNGDTWARDPEHPALGDRHLNAMVKMSDGSLLIVGERGLLALSCDNGRSWEALPEIYPGSFFGALALPDKGVLVYGMRGNAFMSHDLGVTWTKAQLPGAIAIFGAMVDASGALIMVGENNAVLKSTDNGATFVSIFDGERKRFTAVLPAAGDGFVVAGEGGVTVQHPNAKPAGAQS